MENRRNIAADVIPINRFPSREALIRRYEAEYSMTEAERKILWKIIDALCATFPKVQFIVATHSPIVISSAENASILRMLSPDKLEQLPNVYGYNTGDVLELTQDSPDMPEEVKR